MSARPERVEAGAQHPPLLPEAGVWGGGLPLRTGRAGLTWHPTPPLSWLVFSVWVAAPSSKLTLEAPAAEPQDTTPGTGSHWLRPGGSKASW